MEELQKALESHGLKISPIEGKGRALVTTKRFSPGDLIICQEPYVSCPSKAASASVCDGCFSSNKLLRCSACKVAWYCGKKCQKSEWKLHKVECKALLALPLDMPLGMKKTLTPMLRLMIRLLLKKKLQDEHVIPTTAMDNYNLVDALESHMSQISEEQRGLYAQSAYLVKLVLPSMDINIKEVTKYFSKLASNTHTICNSYLLSLGIGLYPVLSFINHSCKPNSVLAFDGPIAFVRALQPIEKDTEVLMSYIETATSTKTRQIDLKKQYYFTCNCPCCNKSPYEEVKENAILEGYCCKDKKCNGFLLLYSETKSFACQQCGLGRSQREIKMLKQELERMVEKAKSTRNLLVANIMYKKVEELEIKLNHPDSLSLLRTREILLKIQMELTELNDWETTLTYCKLVIQMYQKVYPEIHPMLGMQYCVCGWLEWALGNTKEALEWHSKAEVILKIIHGTNTAFMKDFYSDLESLKLITMHGA